MRSRLEPIKKFVRMLRTHAEDILAFIRTRLTNAISEGLNRIIKNYQESGKWVPQSRPAPTYVSTSRVRMWLR